MRRSVRVWWCVAVLAAAMGVLPAAGQQAKKPGPNDARVAAEEGMVQLKGHDDGVTALAFSPDGKLLASGSGDRTIIIWDVAAAKQVRRLEGHSAVITSLCFSPDGQYLLSSAAESTVNLWDTRTWQINSLYGSVGPVRGVRFLPDSDRFVTYSMWSLQLWQVGNSDPEGGRYSDSGNFTAMTVANQEVIYGDRQGNVAVWDGSDDDPKVIHRRPKSSPDKKAAATSQSNFIESVAPGREGHVLVCDRDGLWDWDRHSDQLSFLAKEVWGEPAMLAGNKYLVTGYDRQLWVREADPAGISILFKLGFPLHAVAASPSGDYWAYAGRGQTDNNDDWHRGYPSEVRLVHVDTLSHAFDLAHADHEAAHQKNPRTPLDPTAVTPGETAPVGWDQTGDLP